MARVRPQKFVHVVYRTRRFEQMLDWYKVVFDAEVKHENPALAFLTYDDEHHRFAFANLDVLKPDGKETEKEGLIGVTVSMYYADPDNNQMEFQVECFESSEEANAFMSGPEFAANPIGVEYDPEDWLVQKRAGVPLSSFLARRAHEPASPIRGALG